MNKLNQLAVIAVTILSTAIATQALLAEKIEYKVERFSSFSVGTGMLATVTCGSSNQTTLLGDNQDIKDINVSVEAGHLTVERNSSMGNLFNNMFGSSNKNSQSVKVAIISNSPINLIQGSTGSVISVDACAIDPNQLQVEGGTGSSIHVAGKTKFLELELSTGGAFNTKQSKAFEVEDASVELSTGATAHLCNAKRVTGSASTGATLDTAQQTQTQDVSLGTGADVRKNRCQ